MGSTINHFQLKDEKSVIQKKFKFRDAKGNEIKELNYLVDYIDNSIKKYVEGKSFSVQTKSTKKGKPVDKNYSYRLVVACKKYLKEHYQ